MKAQITVFVLGLTVSLAAWSGPSTSGGGFAVVCRKNEKIVSAELLDLYEARTVQGFILMKPSGDEIKDHILAVKNGYRLQGYHPPISDDEIRKNIVQFLSHAQWLDEDEKLPNLADVGQTVQVPQGCAIEPLAVFYDMQGVVVIDKQIWSSLNSLSRAALVTHELVYRFFRLMKVDPDRNSVEARLLTAADYSLNLIPATSGLPASLAPISEYHKCQQFNENSSSCSQATSFYRFQMGPGSDGKPQFRLQFTFIAGRPLKTITVLDLPYSLKPGDIFPIKSKQLRGWTAEVAQDKSRHNGAAVKLLVRRNSILMFELKM